MCLRLFGSVSSERYSTCNETEPDGNDCGLKEDRAFVWRKMTPSSDYVTVQEHGPLIASH